jgi:hypothetical protein
MLGVCSALRVRSSIRYKIKAIELVRTLLSCLPQVFDLKMSMLRITA